MNGKALYNIIIVLSLFAAMASVAYAANEITQYADQLNYWDAETLTITVSNSGSEAVEANITFPSTFTFVSGTGCAGVSATLITCNISGGASSSYTVTSPGSSVSEYDVGTFSITAVNNTYTSSTDVKFLRIHPSEIFHTLVEYGRGRGNYFFDSYNKTANVSGSGHTGIGCPYLPNGTLFELNYLHKILNIAQYFGLTSEGVNVSFSCTYPNATVVRHHLTTSINMSGSNWLADYFISELQTSWERMGYLGQDFDVGEYAAGSTITVTCTDIVYMLPSANGNVSVSGDSFTLTVVDREPFTVTATAASTIYNGTQEVEITYTITNTGSSTIDDVSIEIQAPEYAQFIGTRGELWGVAQDYYTFERDQFLPGEAETITLVARFNTSSAAGISSLNLSDGVNIEYVTCWELNAYNPAEYIQSVDASAVGTGTVDLNTATAITGVQNSLTEIINILNSINTTITNIETISTQINATVNAIYNLTWWVNESTWNISYQVWNYYNRNLTYYPVSVSAAGTGGGFGSACRWNDTYYYNNTLSDTNFESIYGNNLLRTDFNGIYNGSTDIWRICARVAPSSATAAINDKLEVYICNNYNGSGSPETNTGCTLVGVHDVGEGTYAIDHFKWECVSVLNQEVTGPNLSVIYECDACAGTSDAWKIALDPTVASVYTYNTSDNGAIWNLTSYESLTSLGWCVPIDFGYEVWSYNNRSLTDYNLTWFFDQFNCSGGSSTNSMCELLYAINLTTTNMQATISIINSTVNSIQADTTNILIDTGNILTNQATIIGNQGTIISNQGTIITNQGTIITNTLTLLDQLNCNGTVDTPICSKLDALNLTVNILFNLTAEMNNTLNSMNATLYLMNQTINNRFDAIDANITILYNLSVDIWNSLNCTDLLAQDNGSVCNRLARIENYTLNINTTLQDVLNIVMYINGTRWGNWTAQDIMDKLNNITATVDLTEILAQLQRMQEFDQELVFLVTDAFSLQQQARKAADNGEIEIAAVKLEESKSKLDQATQRLMILNSAFQAEKDMAENRSGWWIWVVLLAGVCGAFVYLFQKVPEEPQMPRRY